MNVGRGRDRKFVRAAEARGKKYRICTSQYTLRHISIWLGRGRREMGWSWWSKGIGV